MSITTSRANVTRTINSLKEHNKTAEEILTRCSTATPEDLRDRLDPLITTRDMITLKCERLQFYMAALDEAVDRQHDHLDDAELKRHEEYAQLQSEMADKSDTAVVRLNVWIQKAKDFIEKAKRASQNNMERDTTIVAAPTHPEATGIKLLPLPKLPIFTGNVWDFENFMAIFNEVVEKSGQSDFMKFNHLTNALKGEPKELLDKFKLKEENYRKALQALQSKYGSKEKSIMELSKKLESEQAESQATQDQRKLLDQMTIVIGQLEEMDEAVDTRLMKSLVIKKFARRIQEKIFNKKIELNNEGLWTIGKILSDAEAIIAKEEAMRELLPRNDEPKKKPGDKSDKSEKQEKTKDGKKNPPNKSSSSKKKPDPHCVFCKEEGHWGNKCSKTNQERWKVVHDEKLCHLCTKSGHMIADCKYGKPCSKCEKSHHFSLCPKNESAQSDKADSSKKPKPTPPSSVQAAVASNTDCHKDKDVGDIPVKDGDAMASTKNKAFVPTIKAMAFNPAKSEWGPISIMIDTGSDLSFITKSLHEGWKLPNKGEQIIHTRTFNSEKASSTAFTRTAIQIKTPENILELDVNVSDNLAGRIRKAPVSKDDLAALRKQNYAINSGSLDTTTCPEMIIGCDHICEILTGEINSLPSGLNTLGTVWGAATMGRPHLKTNKFRTDTVLDKEESLLFMSIEAIPEDPGRDVEEEQIRDTKMKEPQEFAGPLVQEQTVADKETVEFFEETVEKREDGYYVRLPLKDNHPELPDNFPMSFGRLRQIHQKYSTDVLQKIDDVFQEQKDRNYIEEVELVVDKPGKYRYNPIQAVITPHKTTTKTRVVVDGSSRTKNSVSLNDIIKKGPVILPDMVDMLIRFRAGTNVIVSDVEKAFLQVFLHEDDRDLTRVLWLKDYRKPPTRDNLVCYRFTRVLFGLNVSPFLLAAVILHHLKTVDNQDLAKQIPHSLYVDNLILTTDASTEEAYKTYRKIKSIFQDMHMNIREFLSNSSQLNQLFEEEDKASSQTMKVLGINWDAPSDNVNIEAIVDVKNKETRGTISGAIASNFDPLGFLAPLLLPAKLYQRDTLWNSKYDWTTPISAEDHAKWTQVAAAINGYTKIVPRKVLNKSGINKLITFCDASKEAAAFCVYGSDGTKSHLLFGKSKIRPLKEPWTIPKLETHALMMGTTKTLDVYKALKVDNIAVDEIFILTDSSIALDWLKSIPLKKNTGVLVTRRLEQIRLATSELEDEGIQVQFGHVRSEQNPADLGTRGCDKTTFDKCMWWTGPDFIQGDVSKWSKEQPLFQIPQVNTMCVRVEEVPTDTIFNCEITNNYRKMCRIVAYAVRFLNVKFRKLSKESRNKLETKFPAIKAAEPSSIIWAEELESAETLLLRDQQKAISKDQLKKHQKLGIVENKKGLLVCKGRLENSDLDDSAKNPILIMPNTRLSKQIIDDSHKPFHSSVDQTIDTVRRKFWIPRLRRAAQKYVHSCVQCQKLSKQPVRYPNMGSLPEHRIKRSRPFANTGLDNFGPIPYIKEDGTEGTAIGTIFTCSSTRLLHIELARDSSALEFLNALRRFVAIRGLPEFIVSDNGTNFILSHKIIEEAFKIHDPNKELHHIRWKHITPLSPWKGGFYERMVRTVKEAMYKAIGKKKLTFDELRTILYEVMTAVNSRPLTYPEQDINSKHPIRPQDFVNQEMTTILPLEAALEIKEDYLPSQEGQANETKLNTIRALESSVKRTNEVWNTFQNRYLAQLREHHRVRMDNKRGSPNLPKEGQIVLICDDNQPRNSWKMGRVTSLNPSKDGIIRDVDLTSSNGRTIKRSINMIVPLELDIEDAPATERQPPAPEIPTPPQEEPSQRRYNLRKRKEVNYEEDTDTTVNTISTSPSSLLPTKASSTLFLTLLALMCLTGVTAEKPDVLCNQHGLQLYGQYRNFEACAENYCTSSTRWSWKAGEGQQVWIPPALKIHKHHVTVKVDDGRELHIIEKDCAGVPFCETIDCTLCWSNIVNPECHIIWAIIGSSVLFFFSMLLIHALCYTPIQMKEVIKLCGRAIATGFYCCVGSCRRINPFRRNRNSRWRTMITAMSLLIMTTQACQEIDMISQLEKSCDQDGNCQFYTEETLRLNQAQREGCLRLEKNGTTTKDIRITLVEVELHCQKQTLAFTQEFETRVWSTKRCAHMGSCKGSKCANVTRTSKVPELNEVNHYVGSTGCAESCGGPGCDCFYLSSGCIFYRIYAFPLSVEPVEIFRCLEYTPRATIRVTSTTLNSRLNQAESTEFVVAIGRPFEFKGLTINIDTIETPPAPQMNSWFIKKGQGVALWPENVYPNFRCGPKLQDCTLVEDCHCSPAEDRMMCTCRDQNLTEIFQRPDTHLPVQSGSTRIAVSGKAIKAEFRNSATSTITVKIKDNWKTSIYRTNEVCTTSTEAITGCYACETGVQVNITCTSNKMETMASLECDNETFAIACSPQGAATTISFRSEYARFRRTCVLDCGGKEKSHLELAGNLKYTGSIWTSIYRIISGNTTVYDEINLPDGPSIWKGYMTYVKTLTAALIAAAIIYMITYAAINTTASRITGGILTLLVTIAKVLGRIAWWIITSPVQIYEKVRARRRLAHLHTLIIFLLITMITPTHPLFHSQLIHPSHSFLPTPVHRFSPHTLPNSSHRSVLLPFQPLNVNYTIDNGKFSDKMSDKQLAELITLNKKVLVEQEDLRNKIRDLQVQVEESTELVLSTLADAINFFQQQAGRPGASPTETHDPTVRDDDEGEENIMIRIDGHHEEEYSSPRLDEDSEDSDGESRDEEQEVSTPNKGEEKRIRPKVQRMVKPEGVRKLFPKGHPKTPKIRNITCAFCGSENHLSDVCLHFQTIPKRRLILKEQNKCGRCLDYEDDDHDCADPFCKYCSSGVHHSSICQRAINVMKTPKPVRQIKKNPEVTSARCVFCGANHDPDQCPQVTKHRLEFLQSKTPKRCNKCLKLVERGERGGSSTAEAKCDEKCDTECEYCSSWEHHSSLCPHTILSLEPSFERPAEESRPSGKRPGEDDSSRPLPKRPGHRETVAASHRQPAASSQRDVEDRNRRQGGSPQSRRAEEEDRRRFDERGHRQGSSYRRRSEERDHRQDGPSSSRMEERQPRRK